MSKATDINKYPSGMLDVLESVCYTGEPCSIEYPDNTSAKRERFQFYGLVRAMQINHHSLKDKVRLLTFSVGGPNKSTLTITLGHIVKSDFYTRVAESHRQTHPLAGPSIGDQAVAALLKQEQDKA
jgi:hypothetical protein